MKDTKVKIPKLFHRANVDTDTVNDQDRTFEVVFATETPVLRMGWEENFFEILSCDKSSIRGDRFTEGAAPLLDAHSRYSVTDQMGRVDSWYIKDGECRAKLIFSTQEKFAGIWSDIKAGIIRSISVGYKVWKYMRESMGDSVPPNYRAVDWEPYEVSLAPIPADYKSKIRADENSEDANNVVIISQTLTRSDMSKEKTRETTTTETTTEVVEPTTQQRTEGNENPGSTSENPIDENQIRTDAVTVERKRIQDIYGASDAASVERTFADDMVSRGLSIEQARTEIINKLAETKNTPNIRTANNTTNMVDEKDKTRTAMEDGLMHRAMPGSVELKDKAHDFKYLSLMDMARRCLELSGDRGNYSPSEMIKRAIATTDYPTLLQNVTKRILRKEYDKIPRPWEWLGQRTTATDFRTVTGVRLDIAGVTFEEIAEGGEYKESMMILDEAATLKLKTYGRKIAITRQAIINDDLGVFNRKPKLIAQGAAMFQAKKVWGLIQANAKTPDGKPLFHADHGNIAAGADKGPPSKATLSKARIAMMRGKTSFGDMINIQPTKIIVPVELLTETETLINGVTNPVAMNEINPFYKKFDIINDPFLTDPNAWYLVDTDQEGIMYAYLAGEEGLYTETQTNFDNDTVETKARLDFDAVLWGSLGWYKNPGI